MRIMTVVGTRPEFIQMCCLSEAIRARSHTEILVHTGQHYDTNMSDVFFADLGLPAPDYHLDVGGSSPVIQIASIMEPLENVVHLEQPDWIVVYGDTNSTVAAGLTAAKLDIPIAHVEAGLRSFDRSMPEEINRIVTDHVSSLLLAPTYHAVANLKREGIAQGVEQVGDVRVDVLDKLQQHAHQAIRQAYVEATTAYGQFALATIHRQGNTDHRGRLQAIVTSLNQLPIKVVLPVHPRLRKQMSEFGFQFTDNVVAIEPVGFVQMLALLQACEIVITDSGGLQKEAYLFQRPIVTVRDNTEWVETVEAGWNRLCSPDPAALISAVEATRLKLPEEHPALYGTLGVSERIVELLEDGALDSH
jgi:UDP-GlcNAc3NAcA epimerase